MDRRGIWAQCAPHLRRIGVALGGSRAATGDETNTNAPPGSAADVEQRVWEFLQTADEAAAAVLLPEARTGGGDGGGVGAGDDSDAISAATASSERNMAQLGLPSLRAQFLLARGGGLLQRPPFNLTLKTLIPTPLWEIWRRVHHGKQPAPRHTRAGEAHASSAAAFWDAEVAGVDWGPAVAAREAAAAAAAEADDMPASAGATSNTVLVTGVTGFLGPALLEVLAMSGRWTTIIALLRPPLTRAALPPAVVSQGGVELRCFASDLDQPRIGLSAEDWATLSSTAVSCVVHSAAHVHHLHTYVR